MTKQERIKFLASIIGQFGDKAPAVVALLTERNARIIKAAKREHELNGRMKKALTESGLPPENIEAGLAAMTIPEYEILTDDTHQ